MASIASGCMRAKNDDVGCWGGDPLQRTAGPKDAVVPMDDLDASSGKWIACAPAMASTGVPGMRRAVSSRHGSSDGSPSTLPSGRPRARGKETLARRWSL